jgi:hypothetical protein
MPLGLFIKRRSVWMLCAFVTALALVYVLWPEPKAKPAPPLPSPNGYDDFLKAGQLLASISASDYTKMTEEESRSLVSTNQEPLRLLRLGLRRDCRVPVEDSMAYYQSHLDDLASFRRLALLLSAEGRLAEAAGHHDEAAKIHLEVVRFGQVSAHGGLIIDKLTGLAIESLGINGLERTTNQLNTQSHRTIIRALEGIDVRDDPAEYIKRDRVWVQKAFGLNERIRTTLVGIGIFSQQSSLSKKAVEQKFATRVVASDRHRRQLLLNLASRAYELENGKRPLRAEELVPSVLRAVPKDPETGTNLVLNVIN